MEEGGGREGLREGAREGRVGGGTTLRAVKGCAARSVVFVFAVCVLLLRSPVVMSRFNVDLIDSVKY